MSITSLPANGQTYTFTPPLITTANGDYHTASTWAAGTVPPAGSTTYILHAVTLTSALTNTGNINVGPGASLTVSSTLTNNGTLDMNGTLQLNAGYVMAGTAPVYGNTSTLVYNTAAAVGTEWTGNGTAAALGIPQNVTIQNGAIVILPSTNRGMAGSFDLLSGSLIMGAADLYVGGNWTRASGTIFTPNSRTVVFDGLAAQQVITITGGGTETFSGFTLDNPFGSQQAPSPNLTHVAIDSTMTFVAGMYTIGTSTNANTLTVNSGISGSTTSSCLSGSSASNLVLGGHGALTLTVNPATSGTTNNVNNLTINRSGPGVITLTNSLQVSGLLTLTDGYLVTTGGGPFTIVAGGSSTTGSNASFVSGPMKKVGDTAFEFPVGKSGKWAAIGISAPANIADVFTAEYFPVAYSNLTLDPSLMAVSDKEYWSLSRTGSSSNITVTLYFNSGLFSGIYSVLTQDLVVAYFNGTDWEDMNGTKFNTGTILAGTVSTENVNSVGFFTFGSPSGVNPLPVSLTEFTATAAGRTAELVWRTESEINNDHFDIERSHDGIGFAKVGQVGGGGTVNTPTVYAFTDYQLPAVNQPDYYYYRLKQVDYNGDFEYSPIRSVAMAGNQDVAMRIFPNPFTDRVGISYMSENNHKAVFTIMDASGRVVLSREVIATDGPQGMQWDVSELARGIYFIKMNGNGVDRTIKMIKE